MLASFRGDEKGRVGTRKEIRRLIVSAGSKNAGGAAAFSNIFSQESSATISLPPPRKSPPFDHRGRLPSCAYAHSPAPLVLSPGIYNTLCFPSTICLGLSAPSLTLLSRVFFYFYLIPPCRVPHPLLFSLLIRRRS